MIAQITDGPRTFQVDLSDPIDISIPLVSGENRLSAWSVSPITIEPVRTNGFIGSVEEGGDVNFRNIAFNPHGHGTHTCLLYTSPSPRDLSTSRMPSSA